MGGKVNEKKVAAQAVKDADKARKTEAAIAADWADPTLAKKAAAANSAAAKADEAYYSTTRPSPTSKSNNSEHSYNHTTDIPMVIRPSWRACWHCP